MSDGYTYTFEGKTLGRVVVSALIPLLACLACAPANLAADPLSPDAPDRACPPNCTPPPVAAQAVAEPYAVTIEVDRDIELDQVHDVVLWTRAETRPGKPADPFVVVVPRADEHQGAVAWIANRSERPFELQAPPGGIDINGQDHQTVPGRSGGFLVSKKGKDGQWRWLLFLADEQQRTLNL